MYEVDNLLFKHLWEQSFS